MMKSALMTSAAAFAILAAAPVAAQQAPAKPSPADTGVDPNAAPEVIVTAQKRSERLQDVPVAVTVVGGDALGALSKANLEAAQYLVPSFTVLKSGTTLNQSLFLRGVGTATFSIAGEPSVSTVVDGVVYSRSGEAFSELVDIDQLEVLRGPQGTLFGKNASAGVISITSKRPTSTFGGYLEASYFTDTEYRARAAINVPLSENVLTRLTGFYSNYDGNIRNVTTNSLVNGWEHYGARFQVEARPTSNVTLTFIADYYQNDDDCCAEIIATPPINGATGLPTTNLSTAALPTPRGADTRQIAQNLVTATQERGFGFSLTADIALGLHTLTSITSYRDWRNTEIRDGDWLPQSFIGFNQLHDFGPQTGNTVTQEFRLASPAKQFITYVVGAFYSQAISNRTFSRFVERCASAVTPAPTVLTPCTSPLAAPRTFPVGTAVFGSTFQNFALFGQGNVNLADWFRLIGGVRYTHDDLSVSHRRVSANLDTVNGVPVGTAGIAPNFDQGVFDSPGINGVVTASNGIPFRAATASDNVSGKVGVQADLSKNSTAYFTYSRGYKGPAFNVFFNLSKNGTNVIAPETSNAYEIGLKNSLFNGRLVFNIAAFLAQYDNFQANNPDLIAGVVVTRFTNAGRVSTRGVEVDATWRPMRDLTINGGFAWTDAHVDAFNAPLGATVIPSGTPLAFAPRFKGNLSADYRWRTGGAIDAFFGAQGSYQSSQLSLFAADPVQRRLGTIGAYGLVNLSAGIVDAKDRYRITFQVRNVADQSFAAAIANGGPGGAYRYQIPRDADRYFGVTGRFNF
ncbi:TonB-dependent receptor [Sphingomonas sp.]|uniref:TonB-dependent receptor n=1 Tax=Sphingomonas sp. TaxID=28214 RepID=UPI0035A81CE7